MMLHAPTFVSTMMGLWFFSTILHPPTAQVHAASVSISCNGDNAVVPVSNESLALLERILDDVIWPSTLEFIASRNLSSVSYKYCRYGTVDRAVVTAASICDPNNKTDCYNAVEYDKTICRSVSRCSTGESNYFLSADCSSISSDFPSCRLVCPGDSSVSAGIKDCAAGMTNPTNAPLPTSSGWTSAKSCVTWVARATLFLLLGLVQ